ncbi:MAG: 2-(1,2-epoxy,2-dihydrophenyl)acetyl-CoA isomerase [Frankiaceae bacterium]|nr:2-(1,2-epoxy,2-dihydrophenyl)acetyl-CoA isomerase [Frankiaceae bacterium]
MPEPVLYAVDAGVATITFNRPDALNAADASVKDALLLRLQEAAASDVRAVVLTGAGRAFCVGQDLRELEPLYAAPEADLTEIVAGFNRCAMALAALDKPTIAAINGPAAGAGASFAFACDFRLMADTATISLAFAAIGLVPDTGASWTLPRLVGYPKALELLTLPGSLSAAEARSLGLVTAVHPAASLAAETAAFAARLASGPTRSFSLTRRALLAGQTSTYAAALALEAQLQVEAGRTQDHRNAVAAFLRKEKPTFDGR